MGGLLDGPTVLDKVDGVRLWRDVHASLTSWVVVVLATAAHDVVGSIRICRGSEVLDKRSRSHRPEEDRQRRDLGGFGGSG